MLTPNIDGKGKRLRALGGVAFLLLSLPFLAVDLPWPLWTSLGFLATTFTGLFMLFESAKSWCLLRACGIKTRF